MSLIDQIRLDVMRFTTNAGEFGVEITLYPPAQTVGIIVTGIAVKHSLEISPDGVPVKGRNAHISVSEPLLQVLGYPYRNGNGEVDLKGHKVSWTDSSMVLHTYVIRQWMPDETIGLIVCQLGDYTV